MVTVRLESKKAFNIIGTKTWISDHNAFGEFWRKCHQEGDVGAIRKYHKNSDESQTQSAILGLSCTEKDPSIRNFYFFVAVETDEVSKQGKYEIHSVKPYKWAIFRSEGQDFDALMACEMYAWKVWLQSNGMYEHDNGPEIEAYFEENKIEYWVPVRLIESK